MDVWGPHKVATYDRKLYFITIVDDYSRFTWVCLIQSKCEVVTVIKNFLAMIKTQFEAVVKIVRSDNGTKFFNSQSTYLKVISLQRAKKVVLIGYSETQNGYRLYDLENRNIFVSRDMIFREQSFPFERVADSNCTEDLFASQPPILEPQAPIITTPSQNIQVPINAMAPQRWSLLIWSWSQTMQNVVIIMKLQIIWIQPQFTESHMHHEIPADASANQNPYPIILEPKVETSIKEAGLEDVHSQPPSIVGQPRKSNRQGKGRPHVWLKDYITEAKTQTNTVYSISNVLSYDHLSPAYQSFLNAFSVLTEPQSFKEAVNDPRWIEAID
ncbi:uncharacterized protein LOC142178916 [Nicotiana tabacum]|uniref:Uncharacterized protein LOC142178916 n=1 Tax=Nicotiana tabacum TaxID=4097 RepID=A0AC58U5T0_TOBAC